MIQNGKVLIAGGGIGGLTAAIALGKLGMKVNVLERTRVFEEAGAGVQLGPNAVRVLKFLGAAKYMTDQIARPQAFELYDASDGESLLTIPLGQLAESRYGAPYWVVHRQDLQNALLRAIRDLPNVNLENGFHVERVKQDGQKVTVSNALGRKADGIGLIGADGLWSEVRLASFSEELPQFTRKSAFRAVVNTERMPMLLPNECIGIWLGNRSHLEHYPVSAGTKVSLVVMLDGDWVGRDWGASADSEALARRLSGRGWCTDIVRLVHETPEWRKWGLHLGPRLRRWSRNRVTLLGDAAHPVLPFIAQGAGLAIEDAKGLSNAFATAKSMSDVVDVFRKYELSRIKRAYRVQWASQQLGWLLHFGSPLAWARNAAFRRLSGEQVLSWLDWLYGYEQDES